MIWFWCWQVSISYDYANIWEWLKGIFYYSFLVLCFTIFPEQARKNEVGIETTLFINDGKYLKKKALHKFTFVSGGTKGHFLKSSKQLTYLNEKMSNRKNIDSVPNVATRSDSKGKVPASKTVLNVITLCPLMEGTKRDQVSHESAIYWISAEAVNRPSRTPSSRRIPMLTISEKSLGTFSTIIS